MIPRQLFLKLVAPTVFVSLLLVAACGAGALYLNHLHVDIAVGLTENVDSLVAASNLETTVGALARELGKNHNGPDARSQHNEELAERITRAGRLLEKTRRFANLEKEQELVDKIAEGLAPFQARWQKRAGVPADELAHFDADLAEVLNSRVLRWCRELRQYNTDQVEASDRENRLIVNRLTWGLLAVGLAAPLSGLALGYAMARGLYQSICQLSVRIRDAAGRLNSERAVTLEDPNDLPDLHRQMQGVVEEIERVVQRLQQREHEVLRAEQLAALGQVAAGVAHELRNPLTSVKMLVQTGLEGPEPTGLPPEDLAIIESEVRRMEGCIRTFLDYARPPSTERRRADLLGVVRRALALVEPRARRQQVTLAADLPAGAVEVMLDQNQVHQVLVNLLLNALDAMPHGGTVRVEVRPPALPGQPVTVRVHDTGPGIAPRVRDRLFEPFVSGKETGLGLGLSISRRLVEAHGGAITGGNGPHGGAVFTFTLPT